MIKRNMTKFEFIQEAALRLISVGASKEGFYGLMPTVTLGPDMNPNSIGEYISGWAKEIADEVWKLQGSDEPVQGSKVQGSSEEPEVLTAFPDTDTVQVLAKEIARLEAEQIDRENEKAESKGLKGWKGRPYRQVSGADSRFLSCCNDERYGYSRIDTVKDLIACGRHAFRRRRNMGEKTMDLLDKALENLYNIKAW